MQLGRKVLSFIFVFLMLLINIAPVDVLAQSLSETDEEILRLNSEYDQKQAELAKSKADFDATVAQLEDIQNQQVVIQEDINTTNANIAQKQSEIDELNRQIPIMQAQTDVILQGMQRTTSSNFLISIVFGGGSASEIIRTIEGYSTLSEASADKIMELIALQEQLELDQQELEAQSQQLAVQQHELDLNEQYTEQLIAKLDAEVEADESDTLSISQQIAIQEEQKQILEEAGCSGNDVYGIDCGTLNAASGFIRPIETGYVTNEFGGYDALGTGHDGIDLANGGSGEPIYPTADGKVTKAAGASDPYYYINGNYVTILHVVDGQNYTSYYGHMNGAPMVSNGQMVSAYDQIGNIGATGLVTGPHLHFGIYASPYAFQNAINPRDVIYFPEKYVRFNGRI